MNLWVCKLPLVFILPPVCSLQSPVCAFYSKGQVIRVTFSFNLSRNIVALQVEMCFSGNYHPCCKLRQCVAQSWARVYFAQHVAATCNTVVIRARTHFNLHATSWKKMFPVLLGLNREFSNQSKSVTLDSRLKISLYMYTSIYQNTYCCCSKITLLGLSGNRRQTNPANGKLFVEMKTSVIQLRLPV